MLLETTDTDPEFVAAIVAWYRQQGDVPADEVLARLSWNIAEASVSLVSQTLLSAASTLLHVASLHIKPGVRHSTDSLMPEIVAKSAWEQIQATMNAPQHILSRPRVYYELQRIFTDERYRNDAIRHLTFEEFVAELKKRNGGRLFHERNIGKKSIEDLRRIFIEGYGDAGTGT